MTSGRAVLSDTTTARAGWASIVLGFVLVIVVRFALAAHSYVWRNLVVAWGDRWAR